MEKWTDTTIQHVNAVMRANGQGEIHDYSDKPWHRGLVRVSNLRFLHDEFRGVSVAKGRLFANVELDWHGQILDGSLELPREVLRDIRGGFAAALELVVVRDQKRDLYVLDGCKRVLTSCFQGEPDEFFAFVADTGEQREVVHK